MRCESWTQRCQMYVYNVEFSMATEFFSVFYHIMMSFKPINIVGNIELDLNRVVKPFGPIRRQDTNNLRLPSSLFPITLEMGPGLISESNSKGDHYWIQPPPETAPIIWMDEPIGTPLFNPALWFGQYHSWPSAQPFRVGCWRANTCSQGSDPITCSSPRRKWKFSTHGKVDNFQVEN